MTGVTSATAMTPARRKMSTIVLSAGSALTGAGTVMLGVLLPALSLRLGLRDDQSGLLLFLQFFASGLGAICTGLNRFRSLAIGYGLMAVMLGVLALVGLRAAYFAFFVYGLGLGMAMTSTSLVFSDRSGQDRASKLEWLNFTWSAGATAGPVCYLLFLRWRDVRILFVEMFFLSLAMFVWVVTFERHQPRIAISQRSGAKRRSVRTLFPLLLLMAMTTVGIEAALSGWLTTYSERAGMRSLAEPALATSIFWLGEMASRLVFSTRLLARIGRRNVLQWGICGVTVSAILLISASHPWLILVGSAAAGFFMGPLYPLSLSWLLELSPWGWFFAFGGVGAAIFSWLTGFVSAHFHSLRSGLMVPCIAGFAMIGLSTVILKLIPSEKTPVG